MKTKTSILVFIVALVITFLLGLLASSVIRRGDEARYITQTTQPHPTTGYEARNSQWAAAFPRQYESLRATQKSTDNKDALAEDPRQVILWAGYAFAKDYNHPRGHAFAVEDVRNTLRTGAPMKAGDGPQPAACWVCKSPDVPRMMNQLSLSEFYKKQWSDLGSEITNHIGCADCHDPKTMQLTVTRPHLIAAYKAAYGRDISTASHQEMRALVCAQCHNEYYFDAKIIPGAKVVTLPWKYGTSVDAAEKYYDETNFSDYTNALSRVPVIKAQHPDYELWSTGIHAQRGVTCADCHMPYTTDGSQKYSSHNVGNPLDDISRTCQVCHRQDAAVLVKNVRDRQDAIKSQLSRLADQLIRATFEAKAAWDAGATETEMAPILTLIRHAQWRWDYIGASHGAGFHAPLECARVLNDGMDQAANARLQLTRVLLAHGKTAPVEIPDISTKEKAQAILGLDMAKERAAKEQFLKTVVPQWIETAKKNGTYDEAPSAQNKL